MSSNYDMVRAFRDIAIFFIILIVISWLIDMFIYKNKPIKSSKRIVPEIKLIVIDNKIDTVFIYRRP